MEKFRRIPLTLIVVLFLFFSPVFSSPIHAQIASEITTADQLKSITMNGSYRLTADIVLTSANWTPLGNSATPFTGSLDGNGYTIRNLTLSNTQESNQGLFGVIGTAGKVINLRIQNAFVTAADSAGILAGTNQGTISRVSVQGTITGANAVGGLVGTNSGQINDSYAVATVSGQDMNGGLVGSNTGTLNNTYAVGKVTGAVTNTYLGFDGVNDFVSIPHNAAYVAGSFTLEAWFNWTATDRKAVSFIVGKGLEEYEIHTGGSTDVEANGIRFIPINRMDNVFNEDGSAYNNAYNVLRPGWNHVAVTWDLPNKQVRIFLNGIAQDIWQKNVNVGKTATILLKDGITNPLADNTAEMHIGARSDPGAGVAQYFFQGNISDVRLWNKVRTAEEISADKNIRLTGNETGLVGYWKLDETSGAIIYDSSTLHNNGTLHTNPDWTFTESEATRVQVTSTNGGLVGSNTAPGQVVASFYDSSVYGVADPAPIGTPLVTADMKKRSSYTGWDFDYTWDIVEGSSYPTLTDFTVTLNQAAGQPDPTNSATINFTAIFSKPVSTGDFTPAKVTLSAGACTPSAAISQIAPFDATAFNIAVSGLAGTCSVSVSIPAGTVPDMDGTYFKTSTSTDNQVSFDGTVPEVTINQAADQADPANATPIYFTAVFSKPIDPGTFTAEDVTLGGEITGSVTNISQTAPNDNTAFRIEVGNLVGNGTLTASISAGVVEDPVGNLNTAASSTDNTVAYDSAAPSLGISSPSGNPALTSPIQVDFSFSEWVTGFDVSDIIVENGSAGDFIGLGATYSALITPAADGLVTVSVAAGSAVDAAGNSSTASAPFSVTFDGTVPTVTVNQASEQADPTNTGPILFTAIFSEPINTGTFSAADVTLSGDTGAAVVGISQAAPNDGTAFTITVNGITADGDVSVSIPADRVEDLAGNLNTASSSTDNTVTYDTNIPTVLISSSYVDLTNTSPIPVDFIFSKDVIGFSLSDITFTNVSATYFSGSGAVYTADITPTADGLVTVSVAAGVAVDSAGNNNTASDFSIVYDSTRPTVTVNQAGDQSDPTNAGTIHFTAVFSEPIIPDSFSGYVSLTGSSGATAAVFNEIEPNDDTTFDIAVNGMTSDGSVSASLPADTVADLAGNFNQASTSTDNTVTFDTAVPSVVISSTATDPTHISPIPVTFTFSKDVTEFEAGDIVVGNGSLGNFSGTGKIYTAEITPAADGQVNADIAANTAVDAAGNWNMAAEQFAIQYDGTAPTVTINQASDQADPTNTAPIHFIAVFSEPVDPDSFTVEDVTLGGDTGAEVSEISEAAPNDGTTFNITVGSMTADGVVSASILAGVVEDLVGNTNSTSTGTDNSVSYETTGPSIPDTNLKLNYDNKGPASFTITFSKAVYNPPDDTDPDDVTNPANYLLVERGANKLFDTVSCVTGLATDDVQVAVSSVTYNDISFTSTITLAGPLPVGRYRLFVCGTTSIVDLAFNPLNGGTDLIYHFTVSTVTHNDDPSLNKSAVLPNSGFAPGRITRLFAQPAQQAYTGTDIFLDIPSLNVSASIVGIPKVDNQWDVSWLGSSAGYLYGSAYPTWAGNTVLTGHVWNADNTPGIFADLRNLRFGDRLHIHAFGRVYTYEVRENSLVSERNISGVFKSEDKDWVTLLTCEGYNSEENTYAFRRVVRAVLVEVE